MFVLPPPPPRFTSPVAYAAGASNGMPVPIVETSNVVKHPEGGCPLQVGEGTYELREDLHLATPPPHPSEAPVINPNPLATNVLPPTVGVKCSLVIVQPRQRQSHVSRLKSSGTSDLRSIKEAEDSAHHSPSNGSSLFSNPAFGEGNLALTTTLSRDGQGPKRRKPKNNIVKSSSSFVSRVIVNEIAFRRLNERNPEGLYVFANINRAFQWLDYSSKVKHEPLTKILFTKAHMLCHDVNEVTKSTTHLDVIMGSSAGDIIWYEPMQQKYARINKNGAINNSPVGHIKWIPGSENLFMAAHHNGSLVVYDKEKEDAPFTPEEAEDKPDEKGNENRRRSLFSVLKSVNSKNQRTNPVAYWKVSNHRINNFAFSPDRRHLAVVLEDGSLRIIDYLKEKILDLFTSYYGGLICVCWSPDGKYILTGGQDDLVSIWSLADRQIVARCQGHNSWVNCVAFDPWRCDERTYRFGSVGDDCRLLLWDFSVAMLHRPKVLQSAARQRNSVVTTNTQTGRLRGESLSTTRVRSNSNKSEGIIDDEDDEPITHPVEPRARTAQLPPILSKVIGDDPICWLGFLEDSIMTSSLEGHIRTWDRPQEPVNEHGPPSTSGTN
ncbi:hypothetical protein VTO42DRAFT_8306 [Malbranchea cinnamomea]